MKIIKKFRSRQLKNERQEDERDSPCRVRGARLTFIRMRIVRIVVGVGRAAVAERDVMAVREVGMLILNGLGHQAVVQDDEIVVVLVGRRQGGLIFTDPLVVDVEHRVQIRFQVYQRHFDGGLPRFLRTIGGGEFWLKNCQKISAETILDRCAGRWVS